MKTPNQWAGEINDAPYADRTMEDIVIEIRAEAVSEILEKAISALDAGFVLAQCYAEEQHDPLAFKDNNDNYMLIFDTLNSFKQQIIKQ